MSYDVLFFRLKAPIRSSNDLSEATTASLGTGTDVKAEITALFPKTEWHLSHGYWWGRLDTIDTWYEFCIQQVDVVNSFSIQTSHRKAKHSIIHQVCQGLNLVAFDGQVNQLIGDLKPPNH